MQYKIHSSSAKYTRYMISEAYALKLVRFNSKLQTDTKLF